MKKYMSIFVGLFVIFAFACSGDKYIELPYSIQHAYENNDVINVLNGNKSYNTQKLEDFMNAVKNGGKKKIRIVSYHYIMDNKLNWDNPQGILDLFYDGKDINLVEYCLYDTSSKGKLFKNRSGKFDSISKFTTNEDVTYSLIGSNNKKVVILSLVNDGFIDDEARKYLDSILNKK